MTGETTSWEFPTTPNAYDRLFDEGTSLFYTDAFVSKLDTSGGKLIYSTFLGNKQDDDGEGIAVDGHGNAYITGVTTSPSFLTTAGALDERLSGLSDGFLVKLDSTGNRLLYSTFIGGDGSESFYKVALYEGGNAAVVGTSSSENYRTTAGAYSGSYKDANDQTDVVMSVLNAAGNALVYSTYLGEKGDDNVSAVAVGPTGDVYVGGHTAAPAFPFTPGVFDSTPPSPQANRPKMFVARFQLSCNMTVRVGADIAICSGSSLPLTTEVTNGVPPYTYSWAPAQGLNKIDVADPVASPTVTTKYVVTVTDGSGCVAGDTILVTVLDSPVAVAGSDTTVCSGGAALLGGEASGTRPPFTYSWEPKIGLSDPGIARPTARPDATQLYVVTVTDAKGCETKDTVEVRVLPPLTVDVGEDVEICLGGSVRIGGFAAGGEGPYQYAWEPAEGLSQPDIPQPLASPTVTTSYRVLVTDAYGCTLLSEPVKVSVRSGPTFSPVVSGPTSFCKGESVTLDAGAGHADYLWSTGETTRTITVTESGRYSVEVSDGSDCPELSDTVQVTVFPLPDVRIGGPRSVCSQGSAIYSVPEVADVSYDWNLESSSGSIAAGQGSSRITIQWGNPENARLRLVAHNSVTDCADTSFYSITVGTGLEPVIRSSNDVMPLCFGRSVELDAGEGFVDYQWSTGERTRTIVVNQPAVITVTVRDAEGCEGTSAPYEVTMKPALDVTLTPGGELRLCPGATQTLTATPGFASYKWSTGETAPSIDVGTGTYWVEVSDADGCSGWSDTIRILPVENSPVITPSGSLSFCEGDKVTLSAAAGYLSYEWSTGETDRSITVDRSGDYWVKVTGVGGCRATSATTTATVFPLPATPSITRDGDTLISPVAAGYQWVRDGNELSGATGQRYVIDRQGAYRVRVLNSQGCWAESNELAAGRTRVVWLDTVGGQVGERLWLTLHVNPPIEASEGITDYSASLQLSPKALFPHSATPGGGAGGNDPDMRYLPNGTILVKPSVAGGIIEGETLFRLELEGLVTGQPVNSVEIEEVVLAGLGSVPVLAAGVVTLTGCEVGRTFSRRAQILSVVPNPVTDQVRIAYRTPADMRMSLRVLDLLGRVLHVRELEPGSGDEEIVRVELSGLSAGLYLLELRDREEVVTAPLLIRR